MQRPYLRDRLIEERPEGFFVIVPDDYEPPVPLACPVCERLHRTNEDEAAYREFTCCALCALQWAHARRNEWLAGWRPTSEQVRIAIAQRPPLSVTFEVD